MPTRALIQGKTVIHDVTLQDDDQLDMFYGDMTSPRGVRLTRRSEDDLRYMATATSTFAARGEIVIEANIKLFNLTSAQVQGLIGDHLDVNVTVPNSVIPVKVK